MNNPPASPTKAVPWTRSRKICEHTGQFVMSRKITHSEWLRLCAALMKPMKRSFTPPQWETFTDCVLADGERDAMERCEAEVRTVAVPAAVPD